MIGINSAIASRTGYYSGYGFAIPISLAKKVMDDLIEHGRVRRAVLGVSDQRPAAGRRAGGGLKEIRGVLVGGIPGAGRSPRRRRGSRPVTSSSRPTAHRSIASAQLQRIIRVHKPGETIELDAMRYGQKKSFQVRLTEIRGSRPRLPKPLR